MARTRKPKTRRVHCEVPSKTVWRLIRGCPPRCREGRNGCIAMLHSCPWGPRMANLSGIVKQLKKERDRVQHQLSGLNAALVAFAGVYRGRTGTKPRRKLSAKG